MKRNSLSEIKTVNIQDDAGTNRNSEKSCQADVASENEEDEVRIVSIDVGKPTASIKNYLDVIPNIIKFNNNIKITRLNSSSCNSNLYCTEEYSGPEYKKPKLDGPVYKAVLQDKSNENFRGVCHLRPGGLQNIYKSPIILRSNNQFKFENSSTAEVNSVSSQTEKYPLLSICNIKNNEKAIEFYTGLQTYEKFMHVFKSLGSDAYNLRYYYYDQTVALTILDQFFMTLILLRQHKSHYEMSVLFDVTLKDIKNIFITWVRFMKLEWSNVKFPSSYIAEMKMVKSEKNETAVQAKDSDIEIEYVSQDNVNNDGSKHAKTIPDRSTTFKKVYKILNGPQNYIESHLMNDIVFVCQALCYFKAKRIPHKEQNKPNT